MQTFLKDRLPELKTILLAHKVKNAFAFGSVCSEHFTDSSDIDILVKFEEGMDPIMYSDNYFDLLFTLRDYFKREIDLVAENSLRNPYFINSVNQTKPDIQISNVGKIIGLRNIIAHNYDFVLSIPGVEFTFNK